MKFIFLVPIIGFMLAHKMAFAQAELLPCASEEPPIQWEEAFQKLIQERHVFGEENNTVSNQYVIPVVFHIVHGGEAIGTFPNLFSGQIQSQMTILNQDFSGNAYNASNYPPNAFVNWAVNQNIPIQNLDQNGRIKIADFNIQFCLATKDTNGNAMPEPGINRINYQALGLPSPAGYSTQTTMKSYLDNVLKPQTIWDVTKYLNVWITDKSNALTYSGVATGPPLSGLPDLPNNATASTDGIWCYGKAIGSNSLFPAGSYISPIIDGRTLTHEAGHYVGLRHIWGDGTCGNDFCNDTPPAAAQNSGTPVYPHDAGSCTSPSNNPDGEMFMNFMDYTRGPGVYMFTTDQRTRAHTAMVNSPFRNQLGTHNLCDVTTALNPQAAGDKINIYPNPAGSSISISGIRQTLSYTIFNSSGQQQTSGFTEGSINVAALRPGMYLLRLGDGVNGKTLRFHKN